MKEVFLYSWRVITPLALSIFFCHDQPPSVMLSSCVSKGTFTTFACPVSGTVPVNAVSEAFRSFSWVVTCVFLTVDRSFLPVDIQHTQCPCPCYAMPCLVASWTSVIVESAIAWGPPVYQGYCPSNDGEIQSKSRYHSLRKCEDRSSINTWIQRFLFFFGPSATRSTYS